MSTLIGTAEMARSDEAISAYGTARSTATGTPLGAAELRDIDAYWRASLYLCLGMLHLNANPLLREPLKLADLKPRLLGHWGSDYSDQSFTYTHFNRLIKKLRFERHLYQRPRSGCSGCPVPSLSRRDVF